MPGRSNEHRGEDGEHHERGTDRGLQPQPEATVGYEHVTQPGIGGELAQARAAEAWRRSFQQAATHGLGHGGGPVGHPELLVQPLRVAS